VNGHAKCESKLAGTRCLEFGVAIKLNKKKAIIRLNQSLITCFLNIY